ncbi:MAG: IS256 family transposase [Candidatus Scalindua sp.]|jgi:transposase-like protein|nr:IS256 family transposase [Candidatus Scalindua sp.]
MENSTVVELNKPEEVEDVLTGVLRKGARQLLSKALEVEVEAFIEEYRDIRLSDGRQRVVRNGYHRARGIQTGIGEVTVRAPRTEDRESGLEKIRLQSSILPPYLRRSKSIEALLPWLYLKGISTGGFSEALASLLGTEARGLSPATISRLKAVWSDEYDQWHRRDLSRKRYLYFWVDGIHCNVRMDSDKQCLLVIIGATAEGKKELVALEDGYRESEQSWREILMDLQSRGLREWPKVAIGDGAMGFWAALRKVCPSTREQRCWVHKTKNILNKLPKSGQDKAKGKLHDIWMAATKAEALKAFGLFIETYGAKYPKATECLKKDQETLLTFYDFPAEHWRHIRTTNPIESTFATVRLRTNKVRGCFSRSSVLTMAFKLIESAQKRWQRLHSHHRLAEVIEGVKFVDGEAQTKNAA